MPVETKSPPSAEGTPKKKTNSNNALAKVTTLDGGILDVNISVSKIFIEFKYLYDVYFN